MGRLAMSSGSRFALTLISIVFVLLSLVFCTTPGFSQEKYDGAYGTGVNQFIVVTGSPGELGLLRALGEAFARQEDATLLWKKAGSGEALKLLKEKKVDAIMVHDPEGEKKAQKEGWATRRTLIGSNEFFIVGPKNDPAGIGSVRTVVEAYQRIASRQVRFFSRGDNFGTHKKELSIWKKANIEPKGDWYQVSGGFMTETLKRANEEKAYFMTDSSTWIMEKSNLPNLKVLFKGDKFLVNSYHALCQPEKATLAAPSAARFIDFVASEAGQDIIRSYGKERYGEALYDDAAYAAQYE
jgi:tungstate transport system substrate-binding protein